MPVFPHALRGARGLAAAGVLLALTGCSSAEPAQARDDARSACSSAVPSLPAGYDVRTASADQLSELAASASVRRGLAAQAAMGDDRWQSLADAAAAISSFAGVLRDARMTGRALDDVVTPGMWDQYKLASDAFVLECRGALAPDQ